MFDAGKTFFLRSRNHLSVQDDRRRRIMEKSRYAENQHNYLKKPPRSPEVALRFIHQLAEPTLCLLQAYPRDQSNFKSSPNPLSSCTSTLKDSGIPALGILSPFTMDS